MGLSEVAITVSLQGSVRVATGGTISRGIKVRVESLNGELLEEQPVTTAGQFSFSNLPKQTARVVVTGEGYQPYSELVDLGRIANVYFLNISLTPIPKNRERTSQLPARTDVTAPKEARKAFEAGAKALAAKKLHQALTHLEKAVSIYPCYARAQADLGLVNIAEHKSAAAESALRKAIECDPDFIDSYIELGELLNGDKRYAESRPVLEEGIRRSPGSWPFFYQLGVCYFGMGKNQEAEQAYLKAQSFSTDLPAEIHIKLADVYVKEKAYDKAYAQMQAYLAADPNGRFAARTKNVMSQMAAAGVVPSAMAKPPSPAPSAQQDH
jgi:tetratricopeptide (TPR) repeat protein